MKLGGITQKAKDNAMTSSKNLHRSSKEPLGNFISRTSVLTREGLKEIQEIVRNRRSLEVLSWNSDKRKLEYRSIISWHVKSVNPERLFRIHTSKRRFNKTMRWDITIIKCTREQAFYTTSGYVPSCELRNTDTLYTIGVVLNSIQKSVLVGSALGDGSLSKKGKSCLRVTHGYKQMKYCQWKANILRPLVRRRQLYKETSRKGAYSNNPTYSFSARSHWEIIELRHRFYPDGENETIPNDIESDLDELTMAIWFMDDGTTSVRKKTPQKYRIVEICTDRLSEQDVNILISALRNRWGIKSRIHWNPNKTVKKYPRIRMFGNNADRFLDIVSPFIHPSMQYKLKLDVDGNHIDPTKVGSEINDVPSIKKLEWGIENTLISKVEPYRLKYYEDSLVYNIEVEHNHNFFAGGILTRDISNLDYRAIV